MPTAASARKKFLREYRREFSEYRLRAEAAENFIKEILRDGHIEIHKIEGRAKDPAAVHLKLLRKRYKRPRLQLTDKVGIRIITYYSDDVDRIVEVLRPHLEIDKQKSVDKRMELGLRAFGYSSVHLIARLKRNHSRKAAYSGLEGFWFEIQVRSILEHAWAEVEHEIVFKSGIDHPDSVTRRFAAIAGTLEVLAREFLSLKRGRGNRIEFFRRRYSHGLDRRRAFDSVRLLGFLEAEYPKNLSWRQALVEKEPFPPGMETTCVAALKHCRLGTPISFRRLLRANLYRRALARFAAAELKKPEAVSHLALVVIAIAVKSEAVLQDYFPGMAESVALASVLKRRSKRR